MTVNCLPSGRLAAALAANGPGLRSCYGCRAAVPLSGLLHPDFLPSRRRTVAASEVVTWLLTESDTEGVSFSGGEPFAPAEALAEVAERVRAAGKGVLIFTGFQR